ncbi:MAG: MBL fold metallo-hydrolase [Ruminococcaceae bacterium]|nr:MBL fold metallo-hydrolase [Oscillospiraceae bacterium]
MEIKMMQVAPLGTNCYLVCDETEKVCAVVDPGGSAKGVAAAIRETGCEPVCILLTHGHYDHTGGVDGLREVWPDIRVYLSHKDRFPPESAEARLFLPLGGEITDYGEGDTVTVGTLAIRVLSTPGHSEGSVCLLCGDVLISGDTLFADSCGRTDFTGGSMRKMMTSLRRLAQLEGNPAVLPGHMETSDLDTERRRNPYVLQALRSNAE